MTGCFGETVSSEYLLSVVVLVESNCTFGKRSIVGGFLSLRSRTSGSKGEAMVIQEDLEVLDVCFGGVGIKLCGEAEGWRETGR